MGKSLFSVPIFFIVWRETLEAAIIISVLLGLVEQIVKDDTHPFARTHHQAVITDEKKDDVSPADTDEKKDGVSPADTDEKKDDVSPASTDRNSADVDTEPELTQESTEMSDLRKRRLIRKMRIQVYPTPSAQQNQKKTDAFSQIFLGSAIGLFIALAIGAAFIAVWHVYPPSPYLLTTRFSGIHSTHRVCSTAIFELVSAIIIFVMGITMLKLDRAKAKWRVKLQHAFEGKHVDGRTRTSKWALLLLPLITVLREGMEAVVFVGGVTLGQSATSIPIAAIVGLVVGLICGFLIYAFASRSTLTVFLVVMTNLILLIGAGLFSRSVWSFEENAFNHLLGTDVDDAGGDGPGSFDVRNSVWHLDCCNPENNFDNGGWEIFNVLFGWTNSATTGSVLSYVFYWIAVIGVLAVLKFREGRFRVGKWESDVGKQRRERREAAAATSLQ
ncbi:hypothetical protein EW146_g8813 [Bondarzewia mesenterica]|uniref:Iron permease FTR1 n=1 Tax=Bondarzewia mesenterica TaxID=1095465 RepID=A0A4S4LBA4_9AGAM|nr:hypothetical protein EW146_g8813 [Bondarzewia mesenterica]